MSKENNVAAIYVRVSTVKDSQKDSPEHQKMLCEEKARMEGLKVQYVYEDRSSGTSINARPDIQEMLEDAKAGYFSTIIFASLSRFARDTSDALDLKRKFVNVLGVRLISIEDTYDSGVKDDEMIFTIISAVNQKLSEQISISSRRGIRQSAMKGNFTGSRAPFGYKKIVKITDEGNRNSLEIIPEQAAIIKTIFDLYVHQKMGEKAIINYLNHEGIPSPKNGIWGITSIQRILQNEAYTGRNVFNKFTVEKVYLDINNLQNKVTRLKQRDKEEWNRIEEPLWEAIIDDETFSEAQNLRFKRGGGTRGGVRNVKVNPFAGLIKCKHCGSNYVSMKSGKESKEGKIYRYLICSSRRRMGVAGCENGLWIPLEDFRDNLIEALKKELQKHINIEEISSNVKLPSRKLNKDHEKEVKLLEAKILQNRKLLSAIRKQFNLGEYKEEAQYYFEKEDYENEIEELQKKLDKVHIVKEEKQNDEQIRKQIELALKQLSQLDYENIEELKIVLKQLVEEITVNQDAEVEILTPLGVL